MNYFHILTLIFVGFKLANVLQWSWWLVLLPSLISFGVGLVILIGLAAVALYVAAKS